MIIYFVISKFPFDTSHTVGSKHIYFREYDLIPVLNLFNQDSRDLFIYTQEVEINIKWILSFLLFVNLSGRITIKLNTKQKEAKLQVQM